MNCTLISGATGGLGKAFTIELSKTQNAIVLTGRSTEKLQALKAELEEQFNNLKVFIFACDMANENSRLEFFSFIKDNGLKIEKLINVAGVDTQMAFEKYSQEKLEFQIRVNFESVVSVTKFALENRAEKLEILTISSMCASLPIPYFAIYSATKKALLDFFDALRFELKGKNVKITTIMPGSIPTRDDIVEDIKKQGLTGKLSKKSPSFVAKKSLIALNRNKKHYVPGFYNKFVYFFNKITPSFLKTRIIAKKFKNKEKDAF